MTCRECGTVIADKAIVCYRCGTPTAEARPPAASQRRRWPGGPAALVIVIVVALMGVLWWLSSR